MKKCFIMILACVLVLSGCVSSENKKLVRETLSSYFSALTASDFEKANSMVIRAEEDIEAAIEKSSVNELIFKNITYEIWDIKEAEGMLLAEIVVEQISLKAAYIDAAGEFDRYIKEAQSANKAFTDEALSDKWNGIFYKHVADLTEMITLQCTVYISIENDNPAILMTADFRNCLFGGELDAIRLMEQAA